MRHGYTSSLLRVFELVMAALYRHLKPSILNQKLNHLSASHRPPFSVYITHHRAAARFFVHTRHTYEKVFSAFKQTCVIR